MKLKLLFLLIIFFSGLLISFIYAQAIADVAGSSAEISSEIDQELWLYVLRQSQVWYAGYINQHKAVSAGAWQVPIESAFLKLVDSSGEPGFNIFYAVVGDANFNAFCFPGGQFIINAGTLDILDRVIEAETRASLSSIEQERLAAMREKIIAPILAHELGHYYNRHTLSAMKKAWNLREVQPENIDLKMIQFSQDIELEADKTAYLLLGRSGYDPDLILGTLELLNAIQQAALKEVPSASFNTYLSTHPSPHRRLAAFEGERQKMHEWAANMEQAFSDIQLGRNLKEALEVIEGGLALFPGNIYLRKEKAVALHKSWLATVALQDQKLRGIIDSPAFRDEMVFTTQRTRALKAIPGDKALYMKARSEYEQVYSKAMDPAFHSNFALLLAYSPVKADADMSLKLAASAAQTLGTYANLSNLAAVLFLTGMKAEALELLTLIAVEFDREYQKLLKKSQFSPLAQESLRSLRDHIKVTQSLNESYVYDDFTPHLNLALCLSYMGERENAGAVAEDYLSKYESTSSWAQYLSEVTGAKPPKPPVRQYMSVGGIKIGNPITDVLEKWGKPGSISGYMSGEEVWDFSQISAELTILEGEVYQITLTSAKSPLIDGRFGVGSAREQIEKIFGPHRRIANAYFVYEGAQSCAVLYTFGRASEIVLFP